MFSMPYPSQDHPFPILGSGLFSRSQARPELGQQKTYLNLLLLANILPARWHPRQASTRRRQVSGWHELLLDAASLGVPDGQSAVDGGQGPVLAARRKGKLFGGRRIPDRR